MKKTDAEKAIRHLCHEWARVTGLPNPPVEQPSFAKFRSWLNENGYSNYLSFRSSISPLYDAELWFDQEFKQTWRD
jgi:hypothetical protein